SCPSWRIRSAIRSGVADLPGLPRRVSGTRPSARPTTIQENRRARIAHTSTSRPRARQSTFASSWPALLRLARQRRHVPAIPRPGGEAVRPPGVGTTVLQPGAVELVDGLEHPAVRADEVELLCGSRRVNDFPGAAENHDSCRVRSDALAFGDDDLGAAG